MPKCDVYILSRLCKACREKLCVPSDDLLSTNWSSVTVQLDRKLPRREPPPADGGLRRNHSLCAASELVIDLQY